MLDVTDLEIRHAGVAAVRGVSFEVRSGEVVALVGANGAGKSSIMMAVSGLIRPSGGEITFLGERIDRLPPHEIVSRGIVQVPEGRMIFRDMTIGDNLLMGAYARGGGPAVEADLAGALALFPVLGGRLHESAGALSGGELQMLALARGLVARPKLLLLDEPALGLAPLAAREIFGFLKRLSGAVPAGRQEGITILLVEQNLRQALALADRGYVLESGRIVEEGESGVLLRSERVVRSCLGAGTGRGS